MASGSSAPRAHRRLRSGAKRRSLPVVAGIVVLALNWAACSRPDQQSSFVRLADRSAGAVSVYAHGVSHRSLDPALDEHRFSIAAAERGARLLVTPGLTGNWTRPVRFEITWQSGTEPPASIYRRELSEPGWVEEQLTLPSAGPGELVFRTSAANETVRRRAAWGDPTLVTGSQPVRPSVILVSVDTLRADRLGVYGRQEARTPVLDSFLRNTVRYDRAYSPSAWTVPSHQAMLYGIQAAALPFTVMGQPARASLKEYESLAEALRRAGYLTAAFTGGGYVGGIWEMARGFDTFFEYASGTKRSDGCDPKRLDGQEVFGRARAWLRTHADTPFFLFVHTYDAHDRCPVTPQPPIPSWDYSPAQRDALIRYYDDAIARADALVGDLLREIEALGLADSTIVAITSDHGESLWEHDFLGHGCRPLYDEMVHIPLALWLPGGAHHGERVDTPVSTVDLAPTLLALAGVPIPPTMHGAVLPGVGLPAEADRPVYVFCGDWLAVRTGDLKVIFGRETRERRLFNTRDDPDELIDLVAERRRPLGAELRKLATNYFRDFGAKPLPAAAPTPVIDPAMAERLRVLGYAE